MKSKIYNSIIGMFSALIKFLFWILPSNRKDQALVDLRNSLSLKKTVTLKDGKSLDFFCPSHDAVYRAVEFLNKEPETLDWIDSFSSSDIFWDIGANIGSYSLYAAKNKGIEVMAFEPSFANFWLLNENIKLNNLGNKITAYCLAVSKSSFLGTFNMGDTTAGGAHYHFGKAVDSFDYPGLGATKVQFKQGMLGLSIDELISVHQVGFPQHIKIDVDGIEAEIILGSIKTLSDSRLKSVLIEIDETSPDAPTIMSTLKSAGFKFKTYESFDPRYSHIRNYIFTR